MEDDMNLLQSSKMIRVPGATKKHATFFQQEQYGWDTVGEAKHCQNYSDEILIIPVFWSVAPDSSS